MIGYDLDGVLAEAPTAPRKPWRRMTGVERRARTEALRRHYETARPLLNPPEARFVVITARREWARAVTEAWLEARYPGRWELRMLDVARTTRNVIAFKARAIREHRVCTFTEDNTKILRGLARVVRRCRLFLYEAGRVSEVA